MSQKPTTTVESSIEIKAPIAQVFDFAVNPHNSPLIFPDLVAATSIPPLPLKPGDTFDYKYMMYGVMLSGKWTVDEVDRPHYYLGTTAGGAVSHWRYKFETKDDKCVVSLSIEYELPFKVLQKVSAKVIQKINQRVVQTYLKNLSTILEVG